MKSKSILISLISRFAVAAIAATSLCAVAKVCAQDPMADNPYLHKASPSPSPSSATTTTTTKPTPAKRTAAALSAKDKTFIKNAAKGGMEEVEMGKMALQQGKSADVKKFGQRMVTDHTKANNELMALAAKKGFALPNEKTKTEKFGANFDKEYMADMVKDHEKDLAEFQEEAKNGSDPDLKAWAAKTAETVKKHLALAKETQSKLK